MMSACAAPPATRIPGPCPAGRRPREPCRLAPADQQANDETDARSHAHRPPGMIVDVLVGRASSLLALVDHDVLRFRQLDLSTVQAVLDLLAHRGYSLARLAGGRAQQLLHIGDD